MCCCITNDPKISCLLWAKNLGVCGSGSLTGVESCSHLKAHLGKDLLPCSLSGYWHASGHHWLLASSLPCGPLHKVAPWQLACLRARQQDSEGGQTRQKPQTFWNLMSEMSHFTSAVFCVLEGSHQVQSTYRGKGWHRAWKTQWGHLKSCLMQETCTTS